jgi:hypothetical protein
MIQEGFEQWESRLKTSFVVTGRKILGRAELQNYRDA